MSAKHSKSTALRAYVGRLVSAASIFVTVWAFGLVLVQSQPEEVSVEGWVRYARPGDLVWGDFYVRGIHRGRELVEIKDGRAVFAICHDVWLAPVDTPDWTFTYHVVGDEELIVQWQRGYRFLLRVVDENVIALDRQNVEQLVSY